MEGKYVNSECVGQEEGPRNRLDEIFRVLNNQTLVDSCIARLHTLAKKDWLKWGGQNDFFHASSCVLQMRRETLFKLGLLSRAIHLDISNILNEVILNSLFLYWWAVLWVNFKKYYRERNAQEPLNDDTKILTETDTETFFPMPSLPKPRLFF